MKKSGKQFMEVLRDNVLTAMLFMHIMYSLSVYINARTIVSSHNKQMHCYVDLHVY